MNAPLSSLPLSVPQRAALVAVLDRLDLPPSAHAAWWFAQEQASSHRGWRRASSPWTGWVAAVAQGHPAFFELAQISSEWLRIEGPLWDDVDAFAPQWRQVVPMAEPSPAAPLFVVAHLLGQWEVCAHLWNAGAVPTPDWISFLILTCAPGATSPLIPQAVPDEVWRSRLASCLTPARSQVLARILSQPAHPVSTVPSPSLAWIQTLAHG